MKTVLGDRAKYHGIFRPLCITPLATSDSAIFPQNTSRTKAWCEVCPYANLRALGPTPLKGAGCASFQQGSAIDDGF